MTIARIDPVRDHRWRSFVDRHPQASIFHAPGWLEALQLTYGYEPVAYTTARPGQELENGLVCCNINSWLTGKRCVSLPFSDHCQPLVDNANTLEEMLSFIHSERQRAEQKFVEIRPLAIAASVLNNMPYLRTSRSFCFHTLDLSRKEEDIFGGFSKSARNGIRRAERERLCYQSGQSQALLEEFYRLYVPTRHYHGLPPQPFRWFSNLLCCLGDQATIRVASKDGLTVAATVTLTFNRTIVYKYGCSNRKLNKLNGIRFLSWMAVQESKANGTREFDLGRSDLDNDGLTSFKDRFGANRSTLVYYRDSIHVEELRRIGSTLKPPKPALQKVLRLIPDQVFVLAGKLLYRHVG